MGQIHLLPFRKWDEGDVISRFEIEIPVPENKAQGLRVFRIAGTQKTANIGPHSPLPGCRHNRHISYHPGENRLQKGNIALSFAKEQPTGDTHRGAPKKISA